MADEAADRDFALEGLVGLLDLVPAPALLLDAVGRVAHTNALFERLSGRSAAELAGCSERDLFPDAGQLAARPPGERPPTPASARFRGNGQFATLSDSRGRQVPVELSVQPWPSAERARVTFVLVREASQLVAAEQALTDVEERYQAMVASAQAVLWRASGAGRHFSFVSPGAKRLLGYPISDWIQDPEFWVSHLHPDDRDEAVRFTRRRIAAKRDHQLEYRMRRADGGTAWIHDSCKVTADEAGDAVLSGVMLDITAHKSLEEQLLRSQRFEGVGRLAGGIAHDFNNLIGVIAGYTELLQERRTAGDTEFEQLDEIRKAAARASQLTRQLLAFSRQAVLHPVVLDLNQQLVEFDTMVGSVIGEHIRRELVLDPELWPVKVDPLQLQQVLLNLVLNARDAMPEGGALELTTARETIDLDETIALPGLGPGDWVKIMIRDSGSGMSPETMKHLFEPFYTTKPAGKGTGLGLATVYGIVKQSGGSVMVESAAGLGTEFTIRLPRWSGQESGEVPIPHAADAARGGTETILLVEDSDPLRRLLRKQLERAGYAVLEAPGPLAALELLELRGSKIDLLLTDIVMPEMDGRELARRARARLPGLKLLFVSGYSEENREVEPGVPDLLEKPFGSEELVHAVRAALER